MNRVTFYGASDDLVEVDGVGDVEGTDEFNVLPDGADHGFAGTWAVNEDLLVHAFYGRGGTWFFAPAITGECENWSPTVIVSVLPVAKHSDHSTLLVIEAVEPLSVVHLTR